MIVEANVIQKKLVIYGAGGLGREVRSLLRAIPAWHVEGFYDDGKVKGELVGDLPVLGGMDELFAHKENTQVIIAIGNPGIKRKLAERLSQNGWIEFPVVIHPDALLQDPSTLKIGEGTIITAGTIITTEVQLGKHVLVNLNCTLGHDVVVGDFTSIMPGVNIAGEVTIGRGVLIGSGSNLLNGIGVGDQSIIGAGAVVTKVVAASTTVVGIPARSIKSAS